MRSSSRVRVLAELKQREELKLENEKYRAPPLPSRVPFESQFRWSEGEIQPTRDKRRQSTTDPDADTENKRSTRNRGQPQRSQIDERSERAKKRAHIDLEEEEEVSRHGKRSRYVEVDESEVYPRLFSA